MKHSMVQPRSILTVLLFVAASLLAGCHHDDGHDDAELTPWPGAV